MLGLSLGREYRDRVSGGTAPDLSPRIYYDQSPGQDGTLTVYNSAIESGFQGNATGPDAILGTTQSGTGYFIPRVDWRQEIGRGYDGTSNNEHGNFDPFFPNGTWPSTSVLYNQTAPDGTTGWQAIESFQDQPTDFIEFIRFYIPSTNLPQYKNIRRPNNPAGYQDPIKYKITGQVYIDSSGGGWNGTDQVQVTFKIGKTYSVPINQNQSTLISQEYALTTPLNQSSNTSNFNWANLQIYFYPTDTMEAGAKFYFKDLKGIFYWE